MFDDNLSCPNDIVQKILMFENPILKLKSKFFFKLIDKNALKIIGLKICCTKNPFSYRMLHHLGIFNIFFRTIYNY